MPVPLPTFAHLPHRWRASDARVVLAALAASGLTAAEFARRTGITPKRLWRWGAQLNVPVSGRRGPGRPRSAASPARLVELVPVDAPRVIAVADPLPAAPAAAPPTSVVEVRTPGGWQLCVPGELLGALVGALAARSC